MTNEQKNRYGDLSIQRILLMTSLINEKDDYMRVLLLQKLGKVIEEMDSIIDPVIKTI